MDIDGVSGHFFEKGEKIKWNFWKNLVENFIMGSSIFFTEKQLRMKSWL